MAKAPAVHSARNPATRDDSFSITSSVIEIMDEVSRLCRFNFILCVSAVDNKLLVLAEAI